MGTIKKERRRYSISCVAGFRVNMVRSAVAFMEPVLPSAEYPTGVRLIAVKFFGLFHMVWIDHADANVVFLKELSQCEPVMARGLKPHKDLFLAVLMGCLAHPAQEPLELIPAIGEFEHIAGFHATPVEGTGVMRETANIDAND